MGGNGGGDVGFKVLDKQIGMVESAGGRWTGWNQAGLKLWAQVLSPAVFWRSDPLLVPVFKQNASWMCTILLPRAKINRNVRNVKTASFRGRN